MDDLFSQQGVPKVKKSPLLAAVAACLLVLALGVALAPAQRPGPVGPAPGTSRVALVNLNYLFKEHNRFKALMSELEDWAKAEEKQINDERGRIQRRIEEMNGFEKGSPEYKELEREITEDSAKLKVRITQQQEEFLKRQGQIHYSVYQEVYKEIDYYARENGISLVLRFMYEPVRPDKPNEVLRHINKQVVWYSESQDITGIILQRLNGPGPNPGANIGSRDPRLPLR